MQFKPISNPVDGETVVGLFSTADPDVADNWHRRLRLFTGRALSDSALTAEQRGRAGRLALRGQMVSPGVVGGFEVGVEREAVLGRAEETDPAIYWYHVAPGYGICDSGED